MASAEEPKNDGDEIIKKKGDVPPTPGDNQPILPPVTRSRIDAKVVQSSAPFPLFDIFFLPCVPRPGDLLQLRGSAGSLVTCRVEWVNFTPFDQQTSVTIGVSSNAAPSAGVPADQQALQAQVDKSIDFYNRIVEKLTTYTNVVMLAGYAGLFALWSFTKDNLPKRCTDLVAILIGISLVLYVTHEIYGGYIRSKNIVARANNRPTNPSEYFANEKRIEDEENRLLKSSATIWHLVYWPTVLCAYIALLLLMYNLLASLVGWSFWPT